MSMAREFEKGDAKKRTATINGRGIDWVSEHTTVASLRTWKMLKMCQVLYNSKASDSRKPTPCRPSCSTQN